MSSHDRSLVLLVSIIACHAGDRGSTPLRLGTAYVESPLGMWCSVDELQDQSERDSLPVHSEIQL